MKTINIKLLCSLLLTITLAGCMPDSMSKFKKDSPKAVAKVATGVVITDSSGAVVAPDDIIYPTYFRIRKNGATLTNLNLTVNTAITESDYSYIADGIFSTPSFGSLVFLRCELAVDSTDGNTLNDILPPGVELNETDCTLKGTPTSVYTNTAIGFEGQRLAYKFRLYFKNGKSQSGTLGAVTCPTTECYINSDTVNIGVYKTPTDLLLTQNDKIGLKLGSLATSISAFTEDDQNSSTRTDVISSSLSQRGLTQVVDSGKSTILVHRAIPLTVASTTGFNKGDIVGTYDSITVSSTVGLSIGDSVTSGTYTGTISYITGSVLRVIRDGTSAASVAATITNGTVTPNITASTLSANPIFGTITFVDSTNLIIYATQAPEFTSNIFGVTDAITAQGSSTTTTISSIDTSAGVRYSDKIDNDDQYYSQEGVVSEVTQYYPIGSSIQTVSPITTGNDSLDIYNGVLYSISPALPTGLSFNTTTGQLTGTFSSEYDPTEYTVTATNPIGSDTYSFRIASLYPPKDLSYTTNQVIRVSNAATHPVSVFKEGEKIFQPIVAPATESVQGIIKRKFTNSAVASTQQFLEIDTINGLFSPGASIDSGRSYIAEKAFISSTATSYSYNLVFYVAASAAFSIGDYVINGNNARARIIYKNDSRNVLYLQFLTPDTSNATVTFNQGDTITKVGTATTTTISRLESNFYKLKLSNSSTFDVGEDVTADATGGKYVAGYIYSVENDFSTDPTDVDNTDNFVLVESVTRTPSTEASNIVTTHTNEFVTTQDVSPTETYAATGITISSVSHDVLFTFNRGKAVQINPNVSQGSNLNYSIDEALPNGLTLDPDTGVISGTPKYLTTRKTYVVTVKNLLGSSSYKFDLEVRDYFEIADASDSTSVILHKVGDTQNTRGCRVNASDILNSTGNLDIRCFYDAQEEDIYFNPIKFKPLVGSGVCEYVQYAPLSFQQYKVNTVDASTSAAPVHYINGCTDNTAPAAPGQAAWVTALGGHVTTAPTKDMLAYCPANYTGWNDATKPNCDSSKFVVRTHTSTLDATSGNCNLDSSSDATIECGGDIDACIKGPVEDVLTRTQVDQGYRSVIYSTSTGFTGTINHKAPTDFGDYTNLRVANATVNNLCTTTNTDINTWVSKVATDTYNALTDTVPATKTSQLNAYAFVNGNPVYVFNCMDAAYGIKARIRIQVRDWDRTFKIIDSIDSEAPPKMNVPGNDAFGAAYNRYSDWDNDFYSVLNAQYITSSIHSATNYPASNYTGGSCSTIGAGDNYAFQGDEL